MSRRDLNARTYDLRIVETDGLEGGLAVKDAVAATEQAFLDYAEDPDYYRPRQRVNLPSGVWGSLHLAGVPRVGGIGLTNHFHREDPNDGSRIANNPEITVVYDSETSDCQVIFIGSIPTEDYPGLYVAGLRTGSISALGADKLARDDATTLGVLGSGQQARGHIQTFDAIRDFDVANVYSPTEAHRAEFVDEMQNIVDVELNPVSSTEEAVEDMDVVLAATSANEPVFDGDLLEPGQTVISIVGSTVALVEKGILNHRRREIDDTTVERADVVVANSIEKARESEQGDLYLPVERGLLNWEDIVPLHDVVSGAHPGRESDDQIILHKNNTGMGIVDIALATELWETIRDDDPGVRIQRS